jgi:type I restriction enzyme S subunit
MSAERLIAHFERIADAPESVARLRRIILDLAVSGKLVPQDPSDEPASELLRRIAVEKERLASLGQFQEPPTLVRVEREELPFSVPEHWEWTRLVEIAQADYGFAFASDRFNSARRGMPLIRIRDISATDTQAYYDGDYDPSYIVREGDYLVGMDGAFNLRRWQGKDGLLNQRVLRLSGWRCEVNPEYVRLPLQYVLTHLHGRTSQTTVKHLSAKQVNAIEIPLPPLPEQQRIVCKLNELMAVCEHLEATRTKRETVRDRLTISCLARLSEPDRDTFGDDLRFALDALPALITCPNQIIRFRQTMLNLAVRGKLVPQDPSDEPASVLLKHIAASKLERKAETGDARIRVAPDPKQEFGYQLPDGWASQSFENLFLFIDYRGRTPPKTSSGVPLITAKNIRMGHLNREPREYISDDTFESWMTRGFPRIGDLLFTTEAPLANVCLNDISEPFALAQRTICLQPYGTIDTKFVMFTLMSDLMQELINRHATGTTALGIKAAKLKPLPIPIPPLAEQHRIVTKVNELMELFDRVEASLVQTAIVRHQLMEALIAEAPISVGTSQATVTKCS